MAGMQSVIQLENVCFSYRNREVLHNVSFEVREADMVSIVGPNGGGKTTLIHLILGLLNPDRGKVKLFGGDPQRTCRRVGYVPQHLDFDAQFPVSTRDVVRMGAVPYTFWNRPSDSAVEAVLDRVGCLSFAARSFARLSGGEKQKVMIARALMTDPDLLVLDEPTANVDPQAEHDIYEIFDNCHQRIPVLFVSHNLSVVSRYVTHVICVNRTAAIHPRERITQQTIREIYGGELAVLSHSDACHITDPSHVFDEPHSHD